MKEEIFKKAFNYKEKRCCGNCCYGGSVCHQHWGGFIVNFGVCDLHSYPDEKKTFKEEVGLLIEENKEKTKEELKELLIKKYGRETLTYTLVILDAFM